MRIKPCPSHFRKRLSGAATLKLFRLSKLLGRKFDSIGPFKVGGAVRYFGSYWVHEGGNLGERPCGSSSFSASPIGESRQQFCGKVVTDVHVGFRLFKHTELTIGAQNLLNTVPDQNHVGQTRNGRLEDSGGRVIVESPGIFLFSRRSVPFGFNGGFYYARLSVRF